MDTVDAKESDFYSTDKKKLCYIINNEEFDRGLNLSPRSGTQRDFEKLKTLFKKLNFVVENHKNCTAYEMRKNLEEISKRKDLKDYSMFVCFILSHGDEGIIYGRDAHVSIDTMLNYFKGDKCKGLVGKPKLFFIQACRGDKFDKGVLADSVGSNNLDKIPIEADVLIGYSTVPGYFSWRNSSNGSWYIQALCSEIEKNAKTEDVVHILVRVNASVAGNFSSNTGDTKSHGMIQIPSFTCMLRKKVLLLDQN
uniref:Caspase-7 n=1 Tax=Dugesia japonica TaxID=6161 RepID=A0A493QY72_DUGJA|nr:caspase-7 [Dugesia japonica]